MKSADAAHQRRHHHRGQQDHAASCRTPTRTTPGQVVDASNLTVMPGLIEFHSHLQPDFGESAGRAWLAFGITTVRSPGNTPYEAGRGSRGERSERPDRSARLRHRQPDGMAARVLQDGHRHLERRAFRDGAAARQGAAARPAQELRAACPTCSRSAWSSSRTASAFRSRRTRSSRPRLSASTTPSTPRRPAAAATRRRWRRCSAATRT